jgi:phosphoglycolate phosphatase-like HAD superfamily hydrolase
MLLDAAEELGLDLASSWMFGDTDADVAAGHVAGAHAVLIEYPGSAHKRSGEVRPDLLATDLADGVAQLSAAARSKVGGPKIATRPPKPCPIWWR